MFCQYSVAGCSNTDIEIHHVKKLGRRIISNGKITIVTSNNKKFFGVVAILSAVNCKRILLYSFHHLKFETSIYNVLKQEFV